MTKQIPAQLSAEDWVGRQIDELPTPALVIDLPVFHRNLLAMQKLVARHGKSLRPHVKTHKCSTVARLQMETGAVGVTCATLGEAEAVASAGIRDILIANQIVTEDKLDRVARLSAICEPKFVVDSELGIEVAEAVAQKHDMTFEVLVEVDTGGKRCGAQSPQKAVDLAHRVQASSALRFGGIQAYYGGTSYIKDIEERRQAVWASDQVLAAFLKAVQEVVEIPRVSGAGTGNAEFHLQNGLLTEIQAGSYVYSDTTYRDLAPDYPPALFVIATVISQPMDSRIILDAGLKSMGTEFSQPELAQYPHLGPSRFSEEHLQWEVGHQPSPHIGEKVLVIPSHCCTTVNLHRQCFAVQDGKVEERWEIDGF
jgi:D-serine deaminase-like pyridoxal phosphate-dependent protein